MNRKNNISLGLLLCLVGLSTAGQRGWAAPPGNEQAPEQTVREIPLSGELVEKSGSESAEVSGLAWYGDHLIILPQYPERFKSVGDGVIFTIPKQKILAFLDGKSAAKIVPDEIAFYSVGVAGFIEGYQGYEAIALRGNQAFLTIEASGADGAMQGYVAAANIKHDLSELRLTPPILTTVPVQTKLPNMAEESILVVKDGLLVLHEAHGKNVNAKPLAHVFRYDLRPIRAIPFPTIEYRITDATTADSEGRFWGINFFFPGDAELLRPATDELAAKHGQGRSHAKYKTVERLVELQYAESEVKMTDTAPIQLELIDDKNSRNWEGLVRLDDRGFLLMTDQHPRTMLAFVPLP